MRHGNIMREDGKVVEKGGFSNDPEGLEEFIEGVDEAMVAMEAGFSHNTLRLHLNVLVDWVSIIRERMPVKWREKPKCTYSIT